MSRTVEISGSYGTLHVDTTSGIVTKYDADGEDLEYQDIVMFTPADLLREALPHGYADILYVGFINNQGLYTPPIAHRMMWDAQWNDWVIDEVTELLYLEYKS